MRHVLFRMACKLLGYEAKDWSKINLVQIEIKVNSKDANMDLDQFEKKVSSLDKQVQKLLTKTNKLKKLK